MNLRDVGELGERTLALWATQVGISANKSDPDKTGWDFFLELPFDFNYSEGITLPLDLVPRPIQCLVQVKSTDGQPGNWQVKLSSWVRLVECPLPVFFLILEFDGMDSCQRAFLVHVGEKYIKRVLKKLRELSPAQGQELHKIELQFKYSEDDKLLSLNGEGLVQAIHNYVNNLEIYAKWKLEILRTVGYENGKWEMNLVLPPPPEVDVQEYLIDFTLGLIPSIEVTHIEVKDVRFGIASPEPVDVFTKGGILEIINRKSFGDGTILLTMSNGKKNVRFDTQIYLPQGIGFEIEQEYFKVRFAAPFFDFIFWPFQINKADLKYELPHPSEEYTLIQLQPVSELILLLYEAVVKQEKIEIEARINSQPFYTGYINIDGTLSKQVVDYATDIVRAWMVAKYFDIHHKVKLKPVELLRQEVGLMFMASVISPSRPSVQIQYWSSELTDNDKNTCMPYITDIIIGQYRIVIAIAIIGKPEVTGKTTIEGEEDLREFRIETKDIRFGRQYICGRDEAPQQIFEDLARSIVEEYEESTNILIAEGVNDHLIDP